MFHALRKIVIGICCALVIVAGVYVYQKRAIFSPVTDLIEALRIQDKSPPKALGQLPGRVVSVGDKNSFQLKDAHGTTYIFHLAGLSASAGPEATNGPARGFEVERRRYLSQLVLSNQVQVLVTILNEQRQGLGIVYIGSTNVNAAMAEGGFDRVRREYLRGLPWRERYALVHAESKARAQKAGLWKTETVQD
jgi:endonuclease YncB( thermonuclease family)